MKRIPHCKIHSKYTPFCTRCTGARGGSSRSAKKRAAVRRNGKLGGRPKTKRTVKIKDVTGE
jgi:hypothetical protein